MAENQNKLIKFWQELKRRKVVGVIIAYATIAIAIMYFAQFLEDTFELPNWFDKVITLILLIGFPIAIIFSWIFDVSSKGIQKTESLKQETLSDKKSLSNLKPDPPEKSIIVLPFDNISSDPEQEYFSDGLTEEIITDLSYIHDLLVISRSSAMTFKGSKQTLKKIAQKVNVRYVLEGSVRKSGNNLKIVAQLIEASNDSHIWAEKYTGTLDDIFDIQEKVSRSIADSLSITLSKQEDKQITERPIENFQAYECYLKAIYEISHLSEGSFLRAQSFLENGLELYGENALLYATLGYVKYFFYDAGIVTDDAILDEVKFFAKKSLSLNADLAQGYLLLYLLERGRGDLMKGFLFIKKAYKIDPDDPTILVYTASFLDMYAGQSSKAKPLFKRLLLKDPLNPLNYLFAAFPYYNLGKIEEAMELAKKSYQINSEFAFGKYWYAVFHAQLHKSEESFLLLDEAARLKTLPEIHINLIYFLKFVFQGEKEKALKALNEELKQYIWNDPDFSGMMPGWLAMVDQKEESLKFLEHAINRGWINYPFFSKYDSFLENIREEPRFKKLMKKVKIKWENFEV